jgi:hypothetical protein
MDRKDLQSLSRWRLLEAKALLRAGLPNGKYYLAGYAVECALKACIAKTTRRHDFPDKKQVEASYTHIFKKYWEIAEEWGEGSRYEEHTLAEAEKLIEAIGARNHGVFRWIKLFW